MSKRMPGLLAVLFLLVPAHLFAADLDGDTIDDSVDNCLQTPNPTQADADNDGTGDACEQCSDPDGDGACDVPSTTAGDRCPVAYNPDPSGHKIVLSGAPFDGLEVTLSQLRTASNDDPLVVYDGDLIEDDTANLFTQLFLDALTLSSLGAAEAVGATGYLIEGIYEDRALFFDQDAPDDLFGVAFEGGASPNPVAPLPSGYEISRLGKKVLFDWGTSTFPCESYFFPKFAMIDTVTGAGRCFGVDLADQTIADWRMSSDGSWLTWLHRDFNSSVGARVNALSPDFGTQGTIQTATLPGDIFSAPSLRVRADGQALIHTYYDFSTFYCNTRALRVDGPVQNLPGSFDPCATTGFSDQGDGVLLLGNPAGLGPTDLYRAAVYASTNEPIESNSVSSFNEARFSPGESHVAFRSGLSALYLSPASAGGPVTQVATAGNAVAEFGFTPDATALLFDEERAGDQAVELWRVPVGGGVPVQIGPIPQSGAPGVQEWSFESGRLIVLGNFDGVTEQLYSMEPDGSDLAVVTLLQPTDSVAEFWLGFDGGIVMTVAGSSHLFLAPLGGGNAVGLTVPGVEDDVSAPQIFDDGTFLIYDARIENGDRETVVYFAEIPDSDADGILDPCDCRPNDPASGQSPGVPGLVFSSPTTFGWELDEVSDAWTVYRGDLSGLPGDAGACIAEGNVSTGYTDGTSPAAGEGFVYLVAGEGKCGRGAVGPPSDGGTRSVSCPGTEPTPN